jgi:hypothetical protein
LTELSGARNILLCSLCAARGVAGRDGPAILCSPGAAARGDGGCGCGCAASLGTNWSGGGGKGGGAGCLLSEWLLLSGAGAGLTTRSTCSQGTATGRRCGEGTDQRAATVAAAAGTRKVPMGARGRRAPSGP